MPAGRSREAASSRNALPVASIQDTTSLSNTGASRSTALVRSAQAGVVPVERFTFFGARARSLSSADTAPSRQRRPRAGPQGAFFVNGRILGRSQEQIGATSGEIHKELKKKATHEHRILRKVGGHPDRRGEGNEPPAAPGSAEKGPNDPDDPGGRPALWKDTSEENAGSDSAKLIIVSETG